MPRRASASFKKISIRPSRPFWIFELVSSHDYHVNMQTTRPPPPRTLLFFHHRRFHSLFRFDHTTYHTSTASDMKQRKASTVMSTKTSSTLSGPPNHSASVTTTSRWRLPLTLPSNFTNDDDSETLLPLNTTTEDDHGDFFNYVLLILLYTLQGIPMGLSGSIPFLIQQKVKASALTGTSTAAASKLAYKANAIFALCSWPFSLKLLWAPIVDACFVPIFGRRKSWLVPCQMAAGLLMVAGANFVERQLGLDTNLSSTTSSNIVIQQQHAQGINVQGVTLFFFGLYFLMATQDIACDGWALTMLSKKNRGRGPVCNSIGQNIGYFLSFVGFLAFNDPEACETIWRPLLGMASRPGTGLVSMGGFIRAMGYFMLATTVAVALFKHEKSVSKNNAKSTKSFSSVNGDDEDAELDASQIGVKETYHRLWAVCQLPAVRSLFLLLLTYRLPTALSDNVKFLKAVEYGLSKSTTALLSPTVILPLGILVPIVATRIWHGRALRQFMTGYNIRVTLVPLLDLWMLHVVKKSSHHHRGLVFWFAVVASTAFQAIVSSLQFNAQMTFFATRVDPLIGGSYMTLLNTFANLGGTYPSSLVMWLLGALSKDPVCTPVSPGSETTICTGGRDPFVAMQLCFMAAGLLWVALFWRKVHWLESLPDDAWRTHLSDDESNIRSTNGYLNAVDVELGGEPFLSNKSSTRKDR